MASPIDQSSFAPTDEEVWQSAVPIDFVGPVMLRYGRHQAVFPNLFEARRAAEAACHSQVGGFGNVRLLCAPPDCPVTHATLEDWLLD